MRGAWRERASAKGKGGAEKATAQERSGARGAKERRWAGDVERNAREIRRGWEGERRALFRAVEGGDGRWRDGEAQSVERMRCMSVLDELGYTEEEIQRFLEAAGDTEDEVAWAQFVRGLGMLQVRVVAYYLRVCYPVPQTDICCADLGSGRTYLML
eukprot:3016764-Rhodomonas_salina.1